ncbi:MAG: hypothetical protein WCA32_13690 [Chromatiaceae bacterium]
MGRKPEWRDLLHLHAPDALADLGDGALGAGRLERLEGRKTRRQDEQRNQLGVVACAFVLVQDNAQGRATLSS